MLELLYKMPDSQVEQIEKPKHPRKEIIPLPPDVAHGVGYLLDQMLGEPIREIGIILENSQALRHETNQNLRDLIADIKSSRATIRNIIDGLLWSEKTQIRRSNGKTHFEFSGRVSEKHLQPAAIDITGKPLELIVDTLQDNIGNNLSVLSGNSETVKQLSKIQGVRVDSEVIHARSQDLVEAFKPLANLERIKVVTDDEGNRKFELIPNRERALIG